MDNFCTFHQQPHSEKNFPQWINSMTLVMNQFLDSKLIETDNKEEKNNQSTEKQEDDALVLWDCVSLFDTEDEGSLKHEEISETNVTTRSQGLLNKDNSILPKIKRLQENVKKIQKNNIDDKIPEFTFTSQDPKQVNMHVKPIEDKVDNVKENLKAPEMGYDIVEDIKRAKEKTVIGLLY